MIKFSSNILLLPALLLVSSCTLATGMQPASSVVILEEDQGEAVMTVTNTDAQPALLLTTLQVLPQDKESLLQVSPPATRVNGGQKQTVRFIYTGPRPMKKVERLRRVIFEGVAPHRKGDNRVQVTVAQNLPVIIRPAGLVPNDKPWEALEWHYRNGELEVTNPSPYVVRLAQKVQTQPDNGNWQLPQSFILPGEKLVLQPKGKTVHNSLTSVRIFPATTWGFAVEHWDAPLR